MKPRRVAIVARRFWPRAGSLETRVGQLACGLADRGHTVTVVTARWHPHWPAEILYHGLPIVRLDPPPTGRWTTWRWTQALARWLRRHRDELDLVYVWGLMHEARTAVRLLAGHVPVVLVPERTGWHGDCFRQVEMSGGQRIKDACLRADAFVATDPATRRDLEAAGYPRPKIHNVPRSVPLGPPRTPETRTAARSLLVEANAALQLPAQAPLVVSTCRLEAGRGWEQLLEAFRSVADKWSSARLWLAGEAPSETAVLRKIEALGLANRVQWIGVFDTVEGLLPAADVLVAPASEGAPQAILEAMAAGIPAVAIDVPVNRWLLGEPAAGMLVPPHDVVALGEGIARLLGEPELAAQRGAAGRLRVERDFDPAKMIDGHEALMEKR